MNYKKILILYYEIAPYSMACFRELAHSGGFEVHVVRTPVNKEEAPFEFDSVGENVILHNRHECNIDGLYKLTLELDPVLIFCAGWRDKEYLKVIKKFQKETVALLGFDNKWNFSIKKILSSLYAKLFITPIFNYAFVPGQDQKQFALKMGFKNNNIILGAYSADTPLYSSYYFPNKNPIKKVFFFVGRYAEAKGVSDLWTAFSELNKENANLDWELWCFGKGEIPPVNHPKIKHFGFIQPKDFVSYIDDLSIFVLPSHFEPWGVVVHEFAAAGFPILCSDQVGAKEMFVRDEINGFVFEAGNIKQLKKKMKYFIDASEEKINEMRAQSSKLSQQITPTTWANSIIKLIP